MYSPANPTQETRAGAREVRATITLFDANLDELSLPVDSILASWLATQGSELRGEEIILHGGRLYVSRSLMKEPWGLQVKVIQYMPNLGLA